MPIDVDHDMQFESKEPALARLTEISPILSEQSYSPMTDGMTYRDRLGIDNEQIRIKSFAIARCLHQMPGYFPQCVQARNPLLIRTQMGKCRSVIVPNQLIDLLQSRYPKCALHQGNR